MIYDKEHLQTRAKLIHQDTNILFLNSFMRNFGGNLKTTFEGVEDTTLEYTDVNEFEFDGFSVIVENGVFAVQFEEPEEGMVVQNLINEGEFDAKFPYLFEVGGVEKILTKEDYWRIKNFLEQRDA
jgi:hypothetical protein